MTNARLLRTRLLVGSSMACISVLLAGCAPVLIGGAALTTASIASDPRSAGGQLEDTEIELKASSILQSQFSELARINASSYNGVVLLTGDASDEDIRNKAVSLVRAIPNVKSVVDRIVVGPRMSFTQVTSDTWLASRIRTTLIATEGIPSGSFNTTVDNGNVYLQGLVTAQQAADAAKTVSSISGVKEVFTLFDVRSEEEINRLRGVTNTADSQSGSNRNSSGANASNSVGQDAGSATPSAMPIAPPSSPEVRPI